MQRTTSTWKFVYKNTKGVHAKMFMYNVESVIYNRLLCLPFMSKNTTEMSEPQYKNTTFYFLLICLIMIDYDYYRPRSEGDNVLGCVRPSVRPSVSAKKSKEESLSVRGFVCVSNNGADAVDRLLICYLFLSYSELFNTVVPMPPSGFQME